MALLFSYLRNYWPLIALALVLATINQVFSLLDPLIFRYVIDNYATRFAEYTTREFFRGVTMLLAAAVGVAFVSRVAKNFQDYYINLITQRLGAELYSDGIRHSLELPYSVFEDQRSGETLGKLQKVRSDVERLISASINVLFTSLVGIIFVMVYAFTVHWLIAPVYLLTVPVLGIISSVLSKRIKTIQKQIVAETTALAGSTTESLRNIELVKSLGLGQQEIERLNSTTGKILKLELKKVKYLRSLSFIQGTAVNFLRTSILFLMLYLIYTRDITVGQFFSLWIYSFFIFGPLQELGNIINIYRETEASLNVFEGILQMPERAEACQPPAAGRCADARFRSRDVSAPIGDVAGGQQHHLPRAARRDDRLRRPVRRGKNHAREAAGRPVSARIGPDSVQRHPERRNRPGCPARAHRLRHARHAALLRHDSREPAVRQPARHGRRMSRRAAARRRATACWRAPRRDWTR